MDHIEHRRRLDALHALKKEAREAQRHADDLQRAYKDEEALLFTEMDDAGMTGFKSDRANYVRKSTTFASVQDLELFTEWCEANGTEDMFIKDAPQKERLNELVRECLDNGQELPPGIGWYTRNYISITESR